MNSYEAASFLGLKHEWIQRVGTEYEHFDVSLNMRDRAVKQLNAVEMTSKDMIRKIVRPRRIV